MRPKPAERQSPSFVARGTTSFPSLLHDKKALKYYQAVKENS